MIFPFKLLFLYSHEGGFYCNVLKLGVSLIIWSHCVTLSSQSGRFSSRLMSNPIPWWRLFNVLSHLNRCRSLMICFSGSFSSRSQWIPWEDYIDDAITYTWVNCWNAQMTYLLILNGCTVMANTGRKMWNF